MQVGGAPGAVRFTAIDGSLSRLSGSFVIVCVIDRSSEPSNVRICTHVQLLKAAKKKKKRCESVEGGRNGG